MTFFCFCIFLYINYLYFAKFSFSGSKKNVPFFKSKESLSVTLCTIAFAAISGIFFSCAKEELDYSKVNLIGDPKPITVNATLPKSASLDKTTLSADGKVCWESDDKITVNGTELGISEILSDGALAVFEGEVGDITTTYGSGYWATYPTSLNASDYTASSVDVTLPAIQTYSGDNIPNYMAAFSTANGSNLSLSFKNLCSIVKIPVRAADGKTGDAAKLSRIEIVSNRNVSGKATVTMDGGNPSLAIDGDGSKKLIVNCGNKTLKSYDSHDADTFCIILPAGTHNLTVKFYDHAGKFMKKTLSNAGLDRSRIYKTNTIYLDATEGVPLFSVSPSDKVIFSPGNLQYIGRAATPYFKFADNQWIYIGGSTGSGQFTPSQSANRDLFGYGTSGYKGLQPYECIRDILSYPNTDIAGTDYDWGVYNNIYNPATGETDAAGTWRILTSDEWKYLLVTRKVSVNGTDKATYFLANVNGSNGLVILPDNWDGSLFAGIVSFDNVYGFLNDFTYTFNEKTTPTWSDMEDLGVAFLPASGGRSSSGGTYHTEASTMGYRGGYWTGTVVPNKNTAYTTWFNATSEIRGGTSTIMRSVGYAVRLVKDAN